MGFKPVAGVLEEAGRRLIDLVGDVVYVFEPEVDPDGAEAAERDREYAYGYQQDGPESALASRRAECLRGVRGEASRVLGVTRLSGGKGCCHCATVGGADLSATRVSLSGSTLASWRSRRGVRVRSQVQSRRNAAMLTDSRVFGRLGPDANPSEAH